VSSLVQQHQPMLFGPATETLPCQPVKLVEGDKIQLETHQLELSILDLPGHTAGHIAYYGAGKLFCGDTLFACGCGRLFEGTPEQMHHSLSKLAALPENTEVYCTHEYTQSNIQFALAVEPDNPDLQKQQHWVEQQRNKDLPTLPSNIGLEKATNPFLRCDENTIKAAANRYAGKTLDSPVAVFSAIRKWKDSF
jgi:hydroxyacylglutathione hydrolase